MVVSEKWSLKESFTLPIWINNLLTPICHLLTMDGLWENEHCLPGFSLPTTPTMGRPLSTSLSLLSGSRGAYEHGECYGLGSASRASCTRCCCSSGYMGVNSTFPSKSCGHPGYLLLENMDFKGDWLDPAIMELKTPWTSIRLMLDIGSSRWEILFFFHKGNIPVNWKGRERERLSTAPVWMRFIMATSEKLRRNLI